MKDLFERELAIIEMVKSIKLKDLNIIGAGLALIVMIICIAIDKTYYFISNSSILGVLLLLVVALIAWGKKLPRRDAESFTFIQMASLLLIYLINAFFPYSIFWLKLLLSTYVIFNFFIFILGNVSVKKVVKKEENSN